MLIYKQACLSCQSMTFLLITFFMINIQANFHCVYAFSASAQENYSAKYGSETDINDEASQTDEIYEPALLQKEIEASKHRQLQNQMIIEHKNRTLERWEKQLKGKFLSSPEYYDDEPQKPEIMHLDLEKDLPRHTSQVKLDSALDQSEASKSVEETQEVRERLKEEIFRSIQQELDHRKESISDKRDFQLHDHEVMMRPLDEAAVIRKFLEKHNQFLPKVQRNKHLENGEFYDETFENGDKITQIQKEKEKQKPDFIHMRQKLSVNSVSTELPLKEITFDRAKNNRQDESKRITEDRQTEALPTTNPLLTTTSTTVTSATIALYATTLPTPLALESFITIPSTTGLSTSNSLSTTPNILDMLAPKMPTTTAMTTTATTATTVTTRPGGKQGKQINILKRKLQPNEKLRNYIEDAYIRMPLAVIVDPSVESLEKTKSLWRDALRPNLNIKIVLVSLNASGAPAAYSFNSTHQFLAGLNSIKEHGGGDAFTGIVHASELVPYDSAVFISTSALPAYTELIQDAAITLLKKRIRLYLLWFGEQTVSENETQDSSVGGILGEVAIRSGGDILHIVGSESSQELEGKSNTILVADTFQGSQEIEIPIDTTLSSLHVKIDAPTRTATLETPNGDLNLKKFIKFKSHILSKENLDAYVPLIKIRKAAVFKLKIEPENENSFFVFVRADRKADNFLEDMIKRFDSYLSDSLPYYPKNLNDERLRSISSAMAASTFFTHDSLKFPGNLGEVNQNPKYPKNQVETFSEMEIKNNIQDMLKINTSSNASGARQAFENQQLALGRNLLQPSLTRIEMSTQSQLYVEPGQLAQLFFEITNTRTDPVYHNIQVIDEQRYLVRLVPQSVSLRPGESATVAVTVLVPLNAPQGTVDHITFTCHGSGTASLSLNLKVNSALNVQDNTAPTISWNFGSRCEYISSESTKCSERFWTLDITAQDWESGILRLQSSPANRLFYRNVYTVGSTEPLKATYAATCCEPKVSLVAFDVAGNQRSYTFDVRDIYLTEAAIAAIVLGSLLLLVLLSLLIYGIIICCRRRKIVLDLPTYRSHSTRSME